MALESPDRSNDKNDHGWKSLRISRAKFTRTMTAILLSVLQILLLLLRAHYNRNDEQEKALEHLKAAQSKLNDLAEAFEQKLRYSALKPELVDALQDEIDQERRNAGN